VPTSFSPELVSFHLAYNDKACLNFHEGNSVIDKALMRENGLRGSQAPDVIEILRINGHGACIIGEVKREPQGIVSMRTGFGGTRIVDMLVGEQLPRIC
jgi:hypothetical protein